MSDPAVLRRFNCNKFHMLEDENMNPQFECQDISTFETGLVSPFSSSLPSRWLSSIHNLLGV